MHRILSLIGVALALVSPTTSAIPRGAESPTVLTHASQVEDFYDYIIVGAGTAGLTVADRLAENGEISVLVIEYGELSMNFK